MEADVVRVVVIIPARNEATSLGHVLTAIPMGRHTCCMCVDKKKEVKVADVIVVDNGSRDRTAVVAKEAGVRCVAEPVAGYGRACLRALDDIKRRQLLRSDDVVVVLDADYSDFPEEMPLLWEPIVAGRADFVVGSRTQGACEAGALTLPQRWGNAFAGWLLWLLYGHRCSDMGPFRALRYESLMRLHMCDKTYGWNVEMHLKAQKKKLRYVEVPVSYRKRIGQSKISGTWSGVLKAGYKIIATLLRHYR